MRVTQFVLRHSSCDDTYKVLRHSSCFDTVRASTHVSYTVTVSCYCVLYDTVRGLYDTVRGLYDTVRGLNDTVRGLYDTVLRSQRSYCIVHRNCVGRLCRATTDCVVPQHHRLCGTLCHDTVVPRQSCHDTNTGACVGRQCVSYKPRTTSHEESVSGDSDCVG